MARSIRKGPYVPHQLQKKVDALLEKKKKGEPIDVVIKTWKRNSMITPDFIGLTFGVHNGRKHVPVYITDQMVGHKLGEFSSTRLFRGHKNKNKK